jgi:drug/metabolite transporter (DMT)-like permease
VAAQSSESGRPSADSAVARESVGGAAALMFCGSAVFVLLGALVKRASVEATPMQAVLYRSIFSGLPLLILMKTMGIGPISARWKLLLLRAVAGFVALYCFMWGLGHLPIADVLALQQTSPVFVAFLSIALLRERPRPWYYVLASVCLVGALLVVRPTRGIVSLGAAVPLISAVFSSLAYVSVRSLTRTESSIRIVAWFVLVSTVGSLPFCIADWRWLSLQANVLLGAAGLLATLGQLLMTAAYRRAPAYITAAFSYANVPLGYLVGLVFWGEQPEWISTAGIALIAVGGVWVVLKVRAHGV